MSDDASTDICRLDENEDAADHARLRQAAVFVVINWIAAFR
ncbi:hypothetical protein [Mesorhizobium sp. AR10]|nr:hypothetical protein [Mesorhizobium sp. AR10]